MRLFLAIELPDSVRRHLFGVATELKRSLGSGTPVSWTKESNLHITLKFLGEVPDDRVPSIVDAIRAVKAGPPAVRLFTHRIKGFPSSNAARVIVARVLGERDRLVALHEMIEARCAALGFAKENRRFQPHITLG